MKEIKFRAWDKSTRRMLTENDLDYQRSGKMDEIYGTPWRNFVDALDDVKKSENLILILYTGLKDKNGKEIYEGDILKFDSDKISIVTWSHDGSGFLPFIRDLLFTRRSHPAIESIEIEVIGNVYENPELLQKDEKD